MAPAKKKASARKPAAKKPQPLFPSLGKSSRTLSSAKRFKPTVTSLDKARELAERGLGQYTTLAVDDLKLGVYQRPLREEWAKTIANTYNPALFEPLHVALRESDNAYYVVDGQHRLRAAQLLGLHEVPVMLYLETSEAQEAMQFVGLQERRLGLSKNLQFRARVVADDGNARAINDMVEKHGLRISTYNSTNKKCGPIGAIGSVEALISIYERSPQLLDRTLGIAVKAWGTDVRGISSKVLHGIADVLSTFEKVDEVALHERLAALTPADLAVRASIVGHTVGISIKKAMTQVVLDIYNHNRRNRLGA